jgi:hypothetical protein
MLRENPSKQRGGPGGRRRAAQAERTETPSDKALQELLGYQLTPVN